MRGARPSVPANRSDMGGGDKATPRVRWIMRGLRWTTLVVAALIGVAEYGFGQGPSPQTPVEMKTMTAAELEKAGDACRARKEYAEAIQYFREAVRKDKKNPVLYNKLGLAELRA